MADAARSRNMPLLTEEQVEERRPILLRGIEQYNAGFFFQAHETWEELWLPCPWPIRTFLQGLIQMAAGFVHLARHEYTGTVRLLGHALEKLESYPPGYMGIDTARLVTELRRSRDELAALGPERFDEWGRDGIPQISLVDRGA